MIDYIKQNEIETPYQEQFNLNIDKRRLAKKVRELERKVEANKHNRLKVNTAKIKELVQSRLDILKAQANENTAKN